MRLICRLWLAAALLLLPAGCLRPELRSRPLPPGEDLVSLKELIFHPVEESGYYLSVANDTSSITIGLAVYCDSTWDEPPDLGRFTLWFDPAGGTNQSVGLYWPGERGHEEVLSFVEDQLNFWDALPPGRKWEFDRWREKAGPPFMLRVKGVSRPLWPQPDRNGFRVREERRDSLYITSITVPLESPYYRLTPSSNDKISIGLETPAFRSRRGLDRYTRAGPTGMESVPSDPQFRSRGYRGTQVLWFDVRLSGLGGAKQGPAARKILADYPILKERRTGRLQWERRRVGGYDISTPPSVSAQVVVADSTLIEAGLRWYADLLDLDPQERQEFARRYKDRLPEGWKLVADLNMSTDMSPVLLDRDRWTFFIEKDKFFRWEPARVDSSPIRTFQAPARRPEPAPTAETDPLVANFGRYDFQFTPHRRTFRLIFTEIDPRVGSITLVAMPTSSPAYRLVRSFKWPDPRMR